MGVIVTAPELLSIKTYGLLEQVWSVCVRFVRGVVEAVIGTAIHKVGRLVHINQDAVKV